MYQPIDISDIPWDRCARNVNLPKALEILNRIWDGIEVRPPVNGHYRIKLIPQPVMSELWGAEVWRSVHLPHQRSTGCHQKKKGKPSYQLRAKLDTTGSQRTRQLDRIYKRENGICFRCNKFVEREDASREHLFSPISQYPEFAKDDIYMTLAHRWCNL